VDYRDGFKQPEMTKVRLAVVISPKIAARYGLCTIVPLSTKDPYPIIPFHRKINIPFQLPKSWGNIERWIKGDMVNAVAFHRIDLLRLRKNRAGKRIYQTSVLPDNLFNNVRRCVLHGIGCSKLTKHLLDPYIDFVSGSAHAIRV
jgi:mRNA interferase MazF